PGGKFSVRPLRLRALRREPWPPRRPGLLLRDVGAGPRQLGTLRVRVLRERHQPAVVRRSLAAIAAGIGRAGYPEDRAIAVGIGLERNLELAQGRCGLAYLEQQLGVE